MKQSKTYELINLVLTAVLIIGVIFFVEGAMAWDIQEDDENTVLYVKSLDGRLQLTKSVRLSKDRKTVLAINHVKFQASSYVCDGFPGEYSEEVRVRVVNGQKMMMTTQCYGLLEGSLITAKSVAANKFLNDLVLRGETIEFDGATFKTDSPTWQETVDDLTNGNIL